MNISDLIDYEFLGANTFWWKALPAEHRGKLPCPTNIQLPPSSINMHFQYFYYYCCGQILDQIIKSALPPHHQFCLLTAPVVSCGCGCARGAFLVGRGCAWGWASPIWTHSRSCLPGNGGGSVPDDSSDGGPALGKDADKSD